jgi:alkylation response protein AidB-like acyl-CoA dehydrogenase
MRTCFKSGERLMRLAYTDEQEALRQELRTYFARLITPEVEAQLYGARSQGEYGPAYRPVVKQMGTDGWLGFGWPREYGGQGRGAIEQQIFVDEAQRAGAPVPFLTINTVGPTIMHFGTDEQRAHFLPGILKGDTHFSIGYSEPGAGTDLASLRTRAVRDGDEYVINGQKIFTSLIGHADYVWLACRTDPEAKKHKGISIICVPTTAPGFSWTPIHTVGGVMTSSTYYEDVRVPASSLIGGENNGWSLITNQLNHERVSLCSPAPLQVLLDDTIRWAQETKLADGRRVIDQEWVQVHLAKVYAKLEFLRLISWKIVAAPSMNPADASATKVFGTEFFIEAYRLLLECFREVGVVQGDSPDAVLRGKVERMYRNTLILTFGGGTNEIQRDIIAMLGLGMPRAPR